MEIRIKRDGDLSLVCVSGDIDGVTCTQLEEALGRLMDAGGRQLVLDLAGTRHVSSAGLRVVLSAAKRLHGSGRFVISSVSRDVGVILKMAGFTSIIDIYTDLETARAAICAE